MTTPATVPADLKQRLKDSYDSIAPKYNAWTIPNSQQRLQYLTQLLDLLPPGDSELNLLELGCGCGVPVTQKLLEHGPKVQVTANDISTAQVAAARENLASVPGVGERLILVEGDMMALEVAEGSLHAVIAMYSIIHLPRDEQVVLLGKIARWLKPGGFLLANFSDESTEGVVYEGWMGEKGWVFWSGYGADGTRGKIEETGLEVVLGEVAQDAVKSSFLWVIAKRVL
ncbi:methyltransferase [Auriculariales sp. MPI-PUGE-AT-0066]|nr:methyltransferase [Auriculariales sp. MPI-PUGE-AT-0066]